MQKKILSFIVPVRHPENAPDWGLLCVKLEQAARSIAGQTDSRWSAVVVVNRSAQVPVLPRGIELERVDFAPNPLYERGTSSLDEFREAVRLDKGKRILAGLLACSPSDYVMIVDDDDLISCRLTEFAASHADSNGWFFPHGHVWQDGGHWTYVHDDFSRFCGTSHIIRRSLLGLPNSIETAEPDYVKRRLGSHVYIEEDLAHQGFALEPLPFPGAIYRVGHAGAHSGSPGLIRQLLLSRDALAHPRRTGRRLLSMRRIDDAIRREFFGAPSSSLPR